MRADAVAEMLRARPAGRERWSAKCPAHPDKNASLTITQGRRGVLLKCWSQGCAVASIVAALGLRMADLFDGPALTPEKAAQSALVNAAREQWNRQCRAVERARVDRVRDLENVVDGLAARLARDPENTALGGLFHRTVDKLHEAEAAIDHCPPELGGKRMEPRPDSVPWVSAALVEIRATFDTQTKTARCERTA
ncbi:MAG: hypothetical protein RB191_05640 [Terriglobia bacterium]|nr:hypothetical protein [Terriglobia bacterium]